MYFFFPEILSQKNTPTFQTSLGILMYLQAYRSTSIQASSLTYLAKIKKTFTLLKKVCSVWLVRFPTWLLTLPQSLMHCSVMLPKIGNFLSKGQSIFMTWNFCQYNVSQNSSNLVTIFWWLENIWITYFSAIMIWFNGRTVNTF